MRKSIFIVSLLLLMCLPSAHGDDEGNTLFMWAGNAESVELKGEWDWDQTIPMTESGGVWSTTVQLDAGLYCYKFLVDGNYTFDPENSYRGYCDGIENSVVRVGEKQHLSHQLTDDKLIVSSVENPNQNFEFQRIGDNWELDLSLLEDGKHSIELSADGRESLAVFWTGPNSDFSWDEAVIYMIMTDRFVNGNSSNDGLPTGAEEEADWMGGDLEGITQMIQSGYFNDIGINALWVSPFNTNPTTKYIAGDGYHEVSGYHGYWPVEPRQVDPRFGGEQALHEMIDAAHHAGIRVMADFVINHVHEDHVYAIENPEWFNQGCICGTEFCDWTQRRLDCLFMEYMPDVDWKNRAASEQIISDALWWAETFDLDGLRIDAVKHVDDYAITNLATRINERFEATGNDFYLKGETAMGWSGHSLEDNSEDYGMINRYIGENALDGQADFVLYHAVVDNVFTTGNMNYIHLDYWTNRSQDQYVEGAVMVPYLGSHDSPRYISRIVNDGSQWNQWQEQNLPSTPPDSAYDGARQGIAWLLTTPGAPMLYMGDEFGQHGGADPDNRRMLNFELTSSQHELRNFTSELAKIRGEYAALNSGLYNTHYVENDILAYQMSTAEESVLVVLNRGGDSQFETTFDHVIFGSASHDEGSLSIPSNSVTILLQSEGSQNLSDSNNQSIDDLTNNTEANNTANEELDDNSSENLVDNQEMQLCQGCCGSTFESAVSDGPCPVISCDDCEDEIQSSSSSNANLVRNFLAVLVVIALIFFIQTNRRSGDNH